MEHSTRQEAIRAEAKELNAGLTELSPEETSQVRRRLVDVYVPENSTWSEERQQKWSHFFEDNLIETESLGDPEAWEWINGFVKDREVLLLFDYRDGEPVYRIARGERLVSILARARYWIGPNFYVTDENLSFLFGYWTDGYLSAAGTAKGWLHDLKLGAIYRMLGVPERPIQTTQMEVLEWGSQFIFHCLYDPEGEQRPFRLIFRETSSIGMRPAGYDFRIPSPALYCVHLYQEYKTKWVVFRAAKGIRIKMQYQDLIVQKDWSVYGS